MRRTMYAICVLAAALLVGHAAVYAQGPVGTAFTYQGQLKENGVPADGEYDLLFKLFDAPTGGTQVGGAVEIDDYDVRDGLFTVQLDFGTGIFTGDALWLEVAVRQLPDPYTTLSPRQPLNAAPYALYALDGPGSAGFWAASGIDICNTNSGNVGIGTTTPQGQLEVLTSNKHAVWATTDYIPILAYRESTAGTWPAVHAENSSQTDGASGVRGKLTAETPGASAAGVYGHVSSTGANGAGVRGYHSGSGKGVLGEVVNSDGFAGYFIGGRNYFEGNVGMGLLPGAQLTVFNLHAGEQPAVQIRTPGIPGTYDLVFDYCNINARSISSGESRTLWLNNESAGSVLLATGGGNVGIGTDYAQARLHIDDTDVDLSPSALYDDDLIAKDGRAMLGLYSDVNGGGGITIAETDDGYLQDKWSIYRTEGTLDTLKIGYGTNADHNTNPTFVAITAAGNVGIGTIIPTAKLQVAGNAIINDLDVSNDLNVGGAAVVSVLQITGADVAEKFPTSEEVKPGMVVAIDPDHPGQLCLARGAYNRRVAGVVSGANDLPAGAVLGNLPGEEDAPPVAIGGRVWVYCDATEQPIAPGDLLTTATRPGHAMKVTDHPRAQGAVLGKAMTALPEGTGLVLVLVTLQ